ncbi:hypothetical protein 1 [Forsythia suspensa yan-like virus]|nr:hypothetical protein 1 [Forsythia suspensa yan-like virus]
MTDTLGKVKTASSNPGKAGTAAKRFVAKPAAKAATQAPQTDHKRFANPARDLVFAGPWSFATGFDGSPKSLLVDSQAGKSMAKIIKELADPERDCACLSALAQMCFDAQRGHHTLLSKQWVHLPQLGGVQAMTRAVARGTSRGVRMWEVSFSSDGYRLADEPFWSATPCGPKTKGIHHYATLPCIRGGKQALHLVPLGDPKAGFLIPHDLVVFGKGKEVTPKPPIPSTPDEASSSTSVAPKPQAAPVPKPAAPAPAASGAPPGPPSNPPMAPVEHEPGLTHVEDALVPWQAPPPAPEEPPPEQEPPPVMPEAEPLMPIRYEGITPLDSEIDVIHHIAGAWPSLCDGTVPEHSRRLRKRPHICSATHAYALRHGPLVKYVPVQHPRLAVCGDRTVTDGARTAYIFAEGDSIQLNGVWYFVRSSVERGLSLLTLHPSEERMCDCSGGMGFYNLVAGCWPTVTHCWEQLTPLSTAQCPMRINKKVVGDPAVRLRVDWASAVKSAPDELSAALGVCRNVAATRAWGPDAPSPSECLPYVVGADRAFASGQNYSLPVGAGFTWGKCYSCGNTPSKKRLPGRLCGCKPTPAAKVAAMGLHVTSPGGIVYPGVVTTKSQHPPIKEGKATCASKQVFRDSH